MRTILILCLSLVVSTLEAKLVQESYWISGHTNEHFNLLKSRPELTIDHVHHDGFELYGPRGLKKFLVSNNIPHRSMTLINQYGAMKARDGYPTPEAIEKDLLDFTKKFPEIATMFSIGKSVKGRNLWVIKISKNISQNDNTPDIRPEFKYIANMHGDEIVGREMMVRLIKDLLNNYGRDPQITRLVDEVQIYIMPSMNPDGALNGMRGNANLVDLNRDFPDFTTRDNKEDLKGRQPETQAVMKWQKTKNFILSANFHGGAEVINYPWDTSKEKFPEETLIKNLSLEYASQVPYIYQSTVFQNGITNGHDWYEVNGGMQDWSIYWRKDLQITIEVSDDKWPNYSLVDYYYRENRNAMINYIEKTLERKLTRH